MDIKEAIKTLKVLIGIEEFNKLSYKENKSIETLLTAYEKENQEIESLKEKIKTFKIEDENIYLQFGEITEKKRWQDKIKAKVIEVKDRTVKDEFITASQGKLNTIIDIESLLEKE